MSILPPATRVQTEVLARFFMSAIFVLQLILLTVKQLNWLSMAVWTE